MNIERFTQKAQEALASAQNIAMEFNHQTIEPAHLLLALLEQEGGVVPAVVTQISGSVNGLREAVRKDLESRPKVYGANTQVGLSRQTTEVLNAAIRYANGMQD
jgi:ATP-dependent Clp protease ATP-binding subunit ClpB